MSAKANEPKKVQKKVKKSASDVPVNGQPVKQAVEVIKAIEKAREEKKAIEVREPKKVFTYGEVWASRFDIDEDTFNVKREFTTVPVESEEDLANDLEKQKELTHLVKNKLRKNGWFTFDDKLIRSTLIQLESQMDSLRHDIQYEDMCVSEITLRQKALYNIIHEINHLIRLRTNLAEKVQEGLLKKVPNVAPPPNEYTISNGELVKNESEEDRMHKIEKEFGFKEVDINDESVPEQIRGLVKKFGSEATSVRVATAKLKKD